MKIVTPLKILTKSNS